MLLADSWSSTADNWTTLQIYSDRTPTVHCIAANIGMYFPWCGFFCLQFDCSLSEHFCSFRLFRSLRDDSGQIRALQQKKYASPPIHGGNRFRLRWWGRQGKNPTICGREIETDFWRDATPRGIDQPVETSLKTLPVEPRLGLFCAPSQGVCGPCCEILTRRSFLRFVLVCFRGGRAT